MNIASNKCKGVLPYCQVPNLANTRESYKLSCKFLTGDRSYDLLLYDIQ